MSNFSIFFLSKPERKRLNEELVTKERIESFDYLLKFFFKEKLFNKFLSAFLALGAENSVLFNVLP